MSLFGASPTIYFSMKSLSIFVGISHFRLPSGPACEVDTQAFNRVPLGLCTIEERLPSACRMWDDS